MNHPIASALTVLCAGLGGLLVVELDLIDLDLIGSGGLRPAAALALPEAPALPAAQGGPAPLPAFRPPAAEASAVIVERPLFFPSRQPAEPEPVAAAAEPPAEPPDMALIGTIVTTSGRRAIVQSPPGGAAQVLSEGQEIDGWTIAAIETERVLLRRGDEEQAIALEDPASVEAAKPPPAKPAQVAQRLPPKTATVERTAGKTASRGEPPRGAGQNRTGFYTPR